ncbi:hypothetical protein Sjap_026679 [Stephania japonica]|uniref:Uncharacterized protein n=1 Tax=Stephania japonica TaxID=461633 RepID=A0AAP0E294_9MAGN
MGLTLYLGMERGNIACHKSEARGRFPTARGTPRRARRSRATTRERIPHRQGDRRRPSRGTSRPTGNTGETREGNPIGTGVRDLFSATEKKRSRFDSAEPNDTSNTNDLCLECVARSLL